MHVVCMQRWLAMATALAGAAGHGLATCNGRSAAARSPARCGYPRARSPAASPVTSRGDGTGRTGGRPLVGQLPTAKGSRRLRRGSGGGAGVRVKEG
ncbi:hypothetical protein BHE74_00038514 [Ensete ventricosum]|nr:hypothetical protein GW17_00016171 [Ensete ventricosum]RWW54879.1 hypothetical protein BHE74_00038514 [Ensete ventricosum]RZS19864.1 hypothetical protein BHM03_00052315 [Ensete ventricosum]